MPTHYLLLREIISFFIFEAWIISNVINLFMKFAFQIDFNASDSWISPTTLLITYFIFFRCTVIC